MTSIDVSVSWSPSTIDVGGIPFAALAFDDAVDAVIDLGVAARASTEPGTPIRLSNAYCVALGDEDPEYRAVLSGAGVTLPDGTPVHWLMRAHATEDSISDVDQVRGGRLVETVIDRGRARGLRHYFLGATSETLTLMASEIEERYPGTVIAGMHAPAFGPLDGAFFDDSATLIAAADADVVWVGMGTPKQDFAATGLAERLPQPFLGVGAVFDFLAGTVDEAPTAVQGTGFEWLYRLVKEPRRLWRRYLIGNTRFLRVVARTDAPVLLRRFFGGRL